MTSSRHALRQLTSGLAALALGAVLTACGGDAADDVATDTGPTSVPSTSEPAGPTEEPEPGSLPAYPYQDYAYTLEQRCFCANIDQKYRITVEGGEATAVTWATKGEGHDVGDSVDDDADYLMISIQDIIDQGNDPEAAEIDVDWPAGQEYPNSIYIDKDRLVADEEVTWVISDVETA
jgi:hypothetical protein